MCFGTIYINIIFGNEVKRDGLLSGISSRSQRNTSPGLLGYQTATHPWLTFYKCLELLVFDVAFLQVNFQRHQQCEKKLMVLI